MNTRMRKNVELTKRLRAQIIAMRHEGHTLPEIDEALGVPLDRVREVLRENDADGGSVKKRDNMADCIAFARGEIDRAELSRRLRGGKKLT